MNKIETDEETVSELFDKHGAGKYIKYMHLLHELVPDESDKWNVFMNTNKDYYLFDDEVDVIEQNQEIYRDLVGKNKNIIEIGPGTEMATLRKALPFLASLEEIESYTALDIEQAYTFSAVRLVKKTVSGLITSAISLDFMHQIDHLSYLRSLNNKLFFSFNSIIINLHNEQMDLF
jgi:uncharacterized SAM-dependent methyltransferase